MQFLNITAFYIHNIAHKNVKFGENLIEVARFVSVQVIGTLADIMTMMTPNKDLQRYPLS